MELERTDVTPVVARLGKAHARLAALIELLEEGADCEDALGKLAAVERTLARAGYELVSSSLRECLVAPGGVDDDLRSATVERMGQLFLRLA